MKEEIEKRVCPECKRVVYPYAVVRQGLIDDVLIADVGFRCPECSKEWGFEVFSNILLWKQAEERMKKKLKEVIE
jgi:RNase P subunit RPR2